MAAASARRAAGRSVETVGEAELRRFLSAAGMHDSVVSTLASNDIRSLADAKLLSTDDLKELDLPVGSRQYEHAVPPPLAVAGAPAAWLNAGGALIPGNLPAGLVVAPNPRHRDYAAIVAEYDSQWPPFRGCPIT